MCKVRAAKPEDQESVYHLLCELEKQVLPKDRFLFAWNQWLHQKGTFCLILEKDEDVVGYISASMQMLLHHCEWIAEIQECVISNQERGMGLGTMLLEAMVTHLKEQGCAQIEVTPNRMRQRAKHFYERAGFLHTHDKLCLRVKV